ncbi:MAG: TRAP transporter substrate-binding protein DctP [Myxococcota bacterium]
MLRSILLVSFFAVCLSDSWAKPVRLRVATLAPKASSWGQHFSRMRRNLRTKSKRSIRVKLYTDGRMGDEKLMVSKMRLGQLQAASLTSIGLAQIEPSVLLLQQPGMFRNAKEIDHVRDKLDQSLRAKFLHKGFRLLGWLDVGYVYLYSRHDVQTLEKMRKTKVWGWVDDPITKTFAKFAGVTPHMMSILNVRSALQTNAVDTVVGTPLSIIAMQWHPHLKYRLKYRLAIGIGATVITEKSFAQLSPKQQQILLQESEQTHQKLSQTVRRENRIALKVLRKRGLKGLKVAKAQKQKLRQYCRQTWKAFSGRLYSAQELKQVQQLLRTYRAKHNK